MSRWQAPLGPTSTYLASAHPEADPFEFQMEASDAPHQYQHDDDDQNQAQATTGVIPHVVIWGRRGKAPITSRTSATSKIVAIFMEHPGAFPVKFGSPEKLCLCFPRLRTQSRFSLLLKLLYLFVFSQFKTQNRFPLLLDLLQE